MSVEGRKGGKDGTKSRPEKLSSTSISTLGIAVNMRPFGQRRNGKENTILRHDYG